MYRVSNLPESFIQTHGDKFDLMHFCKVFSEYLFNNVKIRIEDILTNYRQDSYYELQRLTALYSLPYLETLLKRLILPYEGAKSFDVALIDDLAVAYNPNDMAARWCSIPLKFEKLEDDYIPEEKDLPLQIIAPGTGLHYNYYQSCDSALADLAEYIKNYTDEYETPSDILRELKELGCKDIDRGYRMFEIGRVLPSYLGRLFVRFHYVTDYNKPQGAIEVQILAPGTSVNGTRHSDAYEALHAIAEAIERNAREQCPVELGRLGTISTIYAELVDWAIGVFLDEGYAICQFPVEVPEKFQKYFDAPYIQFVYSYTPVARSEK